MSKTNAENQLNNFKSQQKASIVPSSLCIIFVLI